MSERGLVRIEDGVMFEREHGVGTVVAYLLHVFPGSTVIPLALQSTMQDTRAIALGHALADGMDAHTVVIISADMSHYLPEAKALENDRLTLGKLASFDGSALAALNDDYVDNRPSFLAVRTLLDDLHITPHWHVLDHSISSRYGGSNAFTTSYLTGLWSDVSAE